MKNKIITILGGSGFVGSHIVKQLANSNDTLKIICNDTEAASYLKTFGSVGQIVLVKGNICDEKQLEKILLGSDIVINLVGKLFEKNKNEFYNIHVIAASNVAKICESLNIKKLIHFSALGVDENQSKYAKTKKEGEADIFKYYPEALIIRPSVIFGKEDNFTNKFKNMAEISPFLPLINGGKTKFQPVHVTDIANLVAILVNQSYIKGKIIEAAGPEIFSFKELLEIILKSINKTRCLISIPNSVANLIGKIFNKFMSNPAITDDQVTSLKYDNIITSDKNMNLIDFGIKPKSLKEAIEFKV